MPRIVCAILLSIDLAHTEAFGEAPAPSAHWGGLVYPDQYSTFTAGLTLDRFTPTDGAGAKYDSTISQTLGLNLITLSRTHHWGDPSAGWSMDLTVGISSTSNEPSEFFQNKVVHQLRHLPSVRTFQARKDTDVMVDGSMTKWLTLWQPKAIFFGGGFSVGTLHQEMFLRTGIRRLQVTPDLYRGDWGSVSVRTSILGRVSLQEDGAVLHATKQTSHLAQPAVAIGQYTRNDRGETVPTWEIEVAVTWDWGIFVNAVGQSRNNSFGRKRLRAALCVWKLGMTVSETSAGATLARPTGSA